MNSDTRGKIVYLMEKYPDINAVAMGLLLGIKGPSVTYHMDNFRRGIYKNEKPIEVEIPEGYKIVGRQSMQERVSILKKHRGSNNGESNQSQDAVKHVEIVESEEVAAMKSKLQNTIMEFDKVKKNELQSLMEVISGTLSSKDIYCIKIKISKVNK